MTTPRIAAVLAAVVAVAACSASDRPSAPIVSPLPFTVDVTAASATLGTTIPMTVTTVTPPIASVAVVDRQSRYIEALLTAGVRVSESRQGEVLLAQGVCQQVAGGADPAKLAADLVAGNVYSAGDARAVVDAAVAHYCE